MALALIPKPGSLRGHQYSDLICRKGNLAVAGTHDLIDAVAGQQIQVTHVWMDAELQNDVVLRDDTPTTLHIFRLPDRGMQQGEIAVILGGVGKKIQAVTSANNLEICVVYRFVPGIPA